MARTPSSEHARHGVYSRTTRSKRLKAWLTLRAASLGRNAGETYLLLQGVGSSILAVATQSRPINRTKPSVTGNTTSGQTLTCVAGTWGGLPIPTITRKWYRDGIEVAGQTAATYLLSAPDITKRITVRETATNTAGATNSISNATAIVA